MENILPIILYLTVVNLFGIGAMAADKSRAVHHKWRIPEKTLFLIAILGGSVGSIAGMQLFRHKTRHATFVIGMPVILLIQIVCFIVIFK